MGGKPKPVAWPHKGQVAEWDGISDIREFVRGPQFTAFRAL